MKKLTAILGLLILAGLFCIPTQAPAEASAVTMGSSARQAEIQRGSSGENIQATRDAVWKWYGPFTVNATTASPWPLSLTAANAAVSSSYTGPVRVKAWANAGATFAASPVSYTPTALGMPVTANNTWDSGPLRLGDKVWFQGSTATADVKSFIGVLE